MSEHEDHRARSLVMWREIMQAEAPPVSDPYTELTTDHLMGWFGLVLASPEGIAAS
jgi:hypothetical protein